MNKNVKVIDLNSKTILFTCPIEEIEKAYLYAKEMEELGLEVCVEAPSITQTLKTAIMMSEDEEDAFDNIIYNEIADHDASCCVDRSGIKIKKSNPSS